MRLNHLLLTTLLWIPFECLQASDTPEFWYRKKAENLSASLNSVAFGNHQFVAVGQGSSVARSTDGLQWVSDSAGAYGDLNRVRFVNGQFVAFPSSAQILVSANGKDWQSRSIPARYGVDIAFGNGVYVLATADDPLYSSDGLNWQPIEVRQPNSFPWEAPISAELQVVVFGKGQFVGFHRSHSKVGIPPIESVAIHSTDGLHWFSSGYSVSDLAESGGGLEFGLDLFHLTRGAITGVTVSADGASWNCSEDCGIGGIPSSTYAAGTAANQKILLQVRGEHVFPSGDGPHIFYSTNGLNWQSIFRFPSPAEDPQNDYFEPLRGVPRSTAYGDGVFVVVGDNGYIIAASVDAGTPSILSEPVDRIAKSGSPATFTVLVSGASPLTYQWYHNNQLIPGANSNLYTLEHVAISDGGTYQVTISNAQGSVQSRLAKLDVAFADVQLFAGVRIAGVVGKSYRVEGTPVIGPEDWQVLDVVQISTTPYVWVDLNTPDKPKRFYRVIELP